MKRVGFVQIIIISIAFNAAIYGDDSRQNLDPDASKLWIGSWKLSADFNRLLGFGDKKSRDQAVYTHPKTFKLTLDKKIGEKIDARMLTMFRDQIFKKMGHKIVATGKWETEFETDPGIDSNCFLTQQNGATFLWVGAPYVVVYGGKVSFIKGLNKKRDVMVIDFNLVENERTPDCVAYQRVSPK